VKIKKSEKYKEEVFHWPVVKGENITYLSLKLKYDISIFSRTDRIPKILPE